MKEVREWKNGNFFVGAFALMPYMLKRSRTVVGNVDFSCTRSREGGDSAEMMVI